MWCTVEIEHHCRNFDDMWESAKETHLLCCSSTQNFPFNDFNICFFSTAATQSVTGCYQVCSLLQNKESSSCLMLMLDNLVLSIIKKAALKLPQMAAVCRQRDETQAMLQWKLTPVWNLLKMYGALNMTLKLVKIKPRLSSQPSLFENTML